MRYIYVIQILLFKQLTQDYKIENQPTMGYNLARSKTISDIPHWANQAKLGQNTSDNKMNYSVNTMSTNTSDGSTFNTLDSTTTAPSSEGLLPATVSTNGSLKSRIVKQRTLLKSETRLYKFSQSLSSLTTVGTATTTTGDEQSRASSCERSLHASR